MKVVSWNVFNLAEDLNAFRNFILSVDADVLALQELTVDHLQILETLNGYRVFQAEDCIEDGVLTYLGIVTRLPATGHHVITHNRARAVSPSLQGRRMQWVECLDSQAVTVDVAGQRVRFANVHLSCAVSPRIRMQQLEEAAEHIEGAERALVCGDFNTYAKLPLNLIAGWFFGFRITDMFVDESKRLDAFAHSYGLDRVFDREITYPRHRLHLDHILARELPVRTAHVEVNTHGSDHCPIVAVFEL